MSNADRVAMNRRIAEGYRDAYQGKTIKEEENFNAWNFAPKAEYVSPYWTDDQVWILEELPLDALKTATMEAQAIGTVFSEHNLIDCQLWVGEDGFVMKNKWVGKHKRDGSEWPHYSYTFARTNEEGQITRWETHINEQFPAFIAEVIGTPGPFVTQADYMDPIAAVLDKNGIPY